MWSKLIIMKKVKIILLVLVSVILLLNVFEYYLLWDNVDPFICEHYRRIIFKYLITPFVVVYLYNDIKTKKEV